MLYAVFGVECGMCKSHAIEGIGTGDKYRHRATTRVEAHEALRREGWARTRAWGWICPKCDKFGSDGVVPLTDRVPHCPELNEPGNIGCICLECILAREAAHHPPGKC